MKKQILLVALICYSIIAKTQINVSGFIYDAESKETIIGANIIGESESCGTSTNTQGYYTLRTKDKKIKVSVIGYESENINLNQRHDTIINIYLNPARYQLEEIKIYANREKPIKAARLDIQEINNLPSLGGQPDVVKSSQILPGIQTQNEASSLLVIRGGDPGQNMFMLDNTALIYTNHLGGFMSVFNPDIINDINIYKAGFPAKYGGKLSSIIDITQRAGNSKEFKGSFGVGITDINLCLEGKITKKITYILTARKTLFDALLFTGSALGEGNENYMTYGFHDINFKSVWKANERNTIALNLFQGDDYIITLNKKQDYDKYDSKIKAVNIWGNLMGALSWNCIVNPKLYARTNFSISRYRLKDIQSFSNTINSGFKNTFSAIVEDMSCNSVWTARVCNNWKIIGGLHFSHIINSPYDYKVEGKEESHKILSEKILNSAISISNKINILKIIETDIGARLTNYQLTDHSKYFIEPRLAVNINLNNIGRLDLDYMKVNQASHLLISSGNIYSNEIWIPASKDIPISNCRQSSVSWTKDILSNKVEISVGAYHKELSNLVSSEKNVYNLSELENWKQSVVTGGVGEVNGLELILKKNYGSWTGSISYHLSKSTRKFKEINNGEEYLYEYHRPHDITIFANHKINDKLSLSFVWNYQTGLPYTPVLGREMMIDPTEQSYYEALIFGERNSSKMRDYHRLDIGLKYEKLSKKRKLKTIWTFSIYNVYNRKNPNYYYYNNNNSNQIHNSTNGFAELNLYQVSIFPLMPSISYKVFFGKRIQPKIKEKKTLKNWLKYE